jgi:hypothetical protein
MTLSKKAMFHLCWYFSLLQPGPALSTESQDEFQTAPRKWKGQLGTDWMQMEASITQVGSLDRLLFRADFKDQCNFCRSNNVVRKSFSQLAGVFGWPVAKMMICDCICRVAERQLEGKQGAKRQNTGVGRAGASSCSRFNRILHVVKSPKRVREPSICHCLEKGSDRFFFLSG